MSDSEATKEHSKLMTLRMEQQEKMTFLILRICTCTMIKEHVRIFLILISVTIFVSFAFLKILYRIGTNAHNSNHMFISQTVQTNSNYLNESIFIDVPRVRILPTSNVENRILTILWINKPVWCNLTFLNWELSRNCPYQNCRMTTDKNMMKQMAAIVFSAQDDLNHIPPLTPTNRPRDQIWVFFRMEPPVYKISWYRDPKWIKTMNWSWGYRQDSDIYFPYGTLNKRNKALHRNYSQIYNNKSRDAAWAVSRCSTQSIRAKYVSKLRSLGLSVDIFGKCSSNKRGIPWSELMSIISRKYKFYLSFESSFCKDYVTEKFFTYFGCDTVLLVRGGLNYSMHFDKSAIVDTADFVSSKDVADFLKKIGNNETLYTQYLRKKDKYIQTSASTEFAKSSCILCEKLNHSDKNLKVYDNIETYIHSNTCFSPKDILR